MSNMPTKSRLILASSSPRRRRLLAEAGLEFDVVEPPIHEPDGGKNKPPPVRQAEAAAYFKARAVADRHPEATVLAADTVVATDQQLLGKPANEDQARQMLRGLSGTRHRVITGVALLRPPHQRLIASATTYVTMRKMSDDEIEAYIESGEWKGKAGAYAIQETADRYVVSVEGSFTNVVGLPVELVLEMLRTLSERPEAEAGSVK